MCEQFLRTLCIFCSLLYQREAAGMSGKSILTIESDIDIDKSKLLIRSDQSILLIYPPVHNKSSTGAAFSTCSTQGLISNRGRMCNFRGSFSFCSKFGTVRNACDFSSTSGQSIMLPSHGPPCLLSNTWEKTPQFNSVISFDLQGR